MNIEISGQHVSITDGLRKHINDKINHLANHNKTIVNARIVLIVDDHKHNKVDLQVHVSGKDLFASHSEKDMYDAIDGAIKKMNHQLAKHKDKDQDHRNPALKKQDFQET